jgi:hypothetical protein
VAVKCQKCHSENPETLKFCGECGTQLPPSTIIPPEVTETLQTPIRELISGSTFAGRYQIIEELGHGGIGTIYTPNVESDTCTARFMTPGRYRMVIISGRWDRVEKYSIAAEFTIERPCRK